jgi:hypothetical protein
LGTVSDNSVMIIKNGVISGSEHKSGTAWTETNSTVTYGSSSDTWGNLNWLPADVNAALEGVTLGVNIDFINITVCYLDPGVLSLFLQDFIVSKKQNNNFITWSVQSPNDFSDFIIQRSGDENIWQDIAEISSLNEKTEYSCTDEYPLKGMNYYRLQWKIKMELWNILTFDLRINKMKMAFLFFQIRPLRI